MYAIFEDSGTQIKVNVGDIVDLDTREVADDATSLTFDKVLAVGSGDGTAAKLGMPYLKGATVVASIVGDVQGDKLRTGKYKRRKGYRRAPRAATIASWTYSRRKPHGLGRKVRTRLDTVVANGHPCAWARMRDSATESKPPNGAFGRAW